MNSSIFERTPFDQRSNHTLRDRFVMISGFIPSDSALMNAVRTELAQEYLSVTDLSIDQISDLIGFTETTAFRRALKKWTGQTPTEFRNALKIGPC
ncbi:MAG: helix-turn-helix transcriptional regulator [Proteobacteria bacterium]|nr:helix-turn-helix transcriptional regulator [Pseudomonadota bacterium]